jgi:sigma-B regulation protein RsbU (phosphoserine phosphatase)
VSPAFPNAAWQQRSVAFNPGDLLFLYTDGVSEALGGDDHDGAEVVIQEIQQPSRVVSPVDAVLARAREQLGGRPQADDLTAMSVRHESSGE